MSGPDISSTALCESTQAWVGISTSSLVASHAQILLAPKRWRGNDFEDDSVTMEQSIAIREMPSPGHRVEAGHEVSQPGPLHGSVTLVLHTVAAQMLLGGRKRTSTRAGILGLFGFARAARVIWHAAERCDPYAAWWLRGVEDAIEDASKTLQRVADQISVQEQLDDAFLIAPGTSTLPCTIALRFSAPHAFLGARLLARYDTVIRTILSARYACCVTPRESRRALYWVGRRVRGAYARVLGFASTGITLGQVRAANHPLPPAAQSMGSLPTAIIDGSRRPRYLPISYERALSVANAKTLLSKPINLLLSGEETPLAAHSVRWPSSSLAFSDQRDARQPSMPSDLCENH